MAGNGGRREGSGRKKGSIGIETDTLIKEIAAKMGVGPAEIMAEMGMKLFNDFQNDRNIDAAVRFWNKIGDRVIRALPTVIEIDEGDSETLEEKRDRINNLLMRRELSQKSSNATVVSVTTVTDNNSPEKQ